MTACDSALIYFWGVTGMCRIGGGGWGLELNFLGFQIEESSMKITYGKQNFKCLSKIKFGNKKIFTKTTPAKKIFYS